MDVRHGKLFGAITVGLIGLMRGGPAGAVVGAAAGANAGGLTAHFADMDFPNIELQALSDAHKPMTSALVILIEHQWTEAALAHIQDLGAQIWVNRLPDDMFAQFLQEDEDLC